MFWHHDTKKTCQIQNYNQYIYHIHEYKTEGMAERMRGLSLAQ